MNTMDTKQLFFNGINGTTGDYLLPPSTPAQVSQMAQPERDKDHLQVVKIHHLRDKEGHYGIASWLDANNLAQAGWGVIFPNKHQMKEVPPHKNPDNIKVALKELLEHRKKEAGELYKEYTYYPPHTAIQFLAENGAGPGDSVDPKQVPYYLLIVGDPEEIPFSFQYQLDVAYAVGRIDFDTLDEYAQYAQSVVKAETSDPFLAPKARFFGTWNNNDLATEQSSKYLVEPLATWADTELKVVWKNNSKYQNWDIQTILKTEATKTKLSQLLGGDETPALLFTASHGLAFKDTRQEKHTGALLCQDWYKEHQGRIPEDWYFSADDISSDANKLLGLIAFHFACYGAGIPKEDEYGHKDKNWKEIAPRAFVAPLPKKLLSHPKGGALAVIGHVDRAWNQSFLWEAIDETAKGEQLSTFKSTLNRLLQGDRVGYAVEEINKRYAALSTELADIFKIKQRVPTLTLTETINLVYKWTANNDARGYAIIGDPAVRLRVAENGTPQTERPPIEQVIFSTPVDEPIPELLKPDDNLQNLTQTTSSTLLPVANGGDIAFGIVDAPKQAIENLSQALTEFTATLGKALKQAVDEATSLEISTYTSDNMTGITYSCGKFESPAKLRALTRIQFNGNTMVCVPENEEGKADETLWKIHADMVQQAQTHRAELLKVMVSSATTLLNSLKGV